MGKTSGLEFVPLNLSMGIVLLMIISFCPSISQQLPIHTYSSRSGILAGGANSIFQDQHGWIWLTNSYDVIRFDGASFNTLPLAKGTSMEYCFDLLEIDDELIVLASPYPLQLRGDSLITYKQGLEIGGIADQLSHQGKEWILTNRGLYLFNNHQFEFYQPLDGMSFNEGETLQPLNDTLLCTYIRNEAVVIINIRQRSTLTLPCHAKSILRQQDKLFVLVNGEGIATLMHRNGIFTLENKIPIADTPAECMATDLQGRWWVGIQDHRLLKIERDGNRHAYTEAEGLPSLWFKAMMTDREGNTWIAFNNGLAKIRNTTATRFTRQEGLYSNHIPAMHYQEEAERLFIITTTGVNLLERNQLYKLTQSGKAFTCHHVIARLDQLYYVRDKSLYTATFDSHKKTVHRENKLADFEGNALFLATDHHGTLFIATAAGLFVYTTSGIHPLLNNQHHYHTLLIDRHQVLWAGSFSSGLEAYSITYDEGHPQVERLLVPDSIMADFRNITQIRAIASDTAGNVYAGTRFNGLYRIGRTGEVISSIEHWDDQRGLSGNSIWGLAIDREHRCWIASSGGLDCLAGNAFHTHPGAASEVFQAASVAVVKGEQVWVGSHPGLVSFAQTISPLPDFNTAITRFTVNDEPISLSPITGGPLRLKHWQNNIAIHFSANSYLDEQTISYSYSLIRSADTTWSPYWHDQQIHFSSLQPGRYTLAVKAFSAATNRTTPAVFMPFEIMRPFWQTIPFLAICLVMVIGAGYGLHRFRIHQLMQLHEVRNAISRDLHDDIGASLSHIHIQATLAQRHLGDQPVAQHHLQRATTDIREISDSLSDLVWHINPAHDDVGQLISHMKRFALDMLEGHDIEPQLDFPPEVGKFTLPMTIRRDLFFIYKEAIHNLVKYSGATVATISFSISQNRYRLVISDNGTGFNPDEIRKGNGLNNLRQRALRMKASLDIAASPGTGVTITVTGRQ